MTGGCDIYGGRLMPRLPGSDGGRSSARKANWPTARPARPCGHLRSFCGRARGQFQVKQVVQSISGGPVRVVDVLRPTIDATQVLVQTLASIISPGTERAVTALAQSSLLAKARARPDLVRQVIDRSQARASPRPLARCAPVSMRTFLGYWPPGSPSRLVRRWPASHPGSSLPPPEPARPTTPSSRPSPGSSARRCPKASRRATPPSPPSPRSPCTVFAWPRSAPAPRFRGHRPRLGRPAQRPPGPSSGMRRRRHRRGRFPGQAGRGGRRAGAHRGRRRDDRAHPQLVPR